MNDDLHNFRILFKNGADPNIILIILEVDNEELETRKMEP